MGTNWVRRWLRIVRATAIAGMTLAATGCGADQASAPDRNAPSTVGQLQVSLLGSAPGPARVVGGTAAMRARAHQILDGMGRPAITEVRFGRAPVSYGQFRNVAGPAWIHMTIATRNDPIRDGLWAQLEADGVRWQAGVFERTYLANPPTGQPRIRGTSEIAIYPGGRQFISSGTAGRYRYIGAAPTEAIVRARFEAAAAKARFRVVSVTFIHPDRVAATVILKATSRHGFGDRFSAFYHGLGGLPDAMGGLQWEIIDRCGNPVAIRSAGFWIHPGWLCPNPFIIGLTPTRAACRNLARTLPVC
jgi:hypothetical protein